MFKFKIIGSSSEEKIGQYCSLTLGQRLDSLYLKLWFLNTNKDESFSSPFLFSNISNFALKVSVDDELLKMSHDEDKNKESVYCAISSIFNSIDNKQDRNEFVYNFLKDYCKSSHFEVGPSSFVKVVSNSGSWVLLSKEHWCDESEIEDLKSQNATVCRIKNLKREPSFHHKELGSIKKPKFWDFFEPGNACVTRKVKSLGPIWKVVDFQMRGKYGSVKKVPVTVGYLAPLDNIFEAKKYYESVSSELSRKKLIRKLNGESKLGKAETRLSGIGEIVLKPEQIEIFKKIIKENKNKL